MKMRTEKEVFDVENSFNLKEKNKPFNIEKFEE